MLDGDSDCEEVHVGDALIVCEALCVVLVVCEALPEGVALNDGSCVVDCDRDWLGVIVDVEL